MSQKQYNDILVDTVKAASAVTANRFVDVDGNHAAANERAYGIARSAATSGEHFPVGVIGIFPVVSSAAIAKGAPVASAADGKAKTGSVADVAGLAAVIGYALEAASAADEEIAIILR